MLQMDLQKAYDTLEWCALGGILKELSFPDKFIRWIMVTVTTVSYRFKINGETTSILKARRGPETRGSTPPLIICYCDGIST